MGIQMVYYFSLWTLLVYSLIAILKIKWLNVLLAVIATTASAFKLITPYSHGGWYWSTKRNYADRQKDEDNKEWTFASWEFAKQIIPLLGIGVLIAGFLLGSTHGDTACRYHSNEWIANLVGGKLCFLTSLPHQELYVLCNTNRGAFFKLMAAGMGKVLPWHYC